MGSGFSAVGRVCPMGVRRTTGRGVLRGITSVRRVGGGVGISCFAKVCMSIITVFLHFTYGNQPLKTPIKC
jgi:hypothetical protein